MCLSPAPLTATGFRCQTCGFRFHQRCSSAVPSLCQVKDETRDPQFTTQLRSTFITLLFLPSDKNTTASTRRVQFQLLCKCLPIALFLPRQLLSNSKNVTTLLQVATTNVVVINCVSQGHLLAMNDPIYFNTIFFPNDHDKNSAKNQHHEVGFSSLTL